MMLNENKDGQFYNILSFCVIDLKPLLYNFPFRPKKKNT